MAPPCADPAQFPFPITKGERGKAEPRAMPGPPCSPKHAQIRLRMLLLPETPGEELF